MLDFAAAVFIGNVITVIFVWGCHQASKVTHGKDLRWIAFAAIGLPLFFAISSLIIAGGLPPHLDAIVAQ